MKNRKSLYIVLVIVFATAMIVAVGLFVKQITNQYGELRNVEQKLTKSNEELYIHYTREISLIKKLSTGSYKKLSDKCNKYSYDCVVEASKIRQSFLESLAISYYPDSDRELLTMISSVDTTLSLQLDTYNQYVEEYTDLSEKLPLKIWLLISFQSDKYGKL